MLMFVVLRVGYIVDRGAGLGHGPNRPNMLGAISRPIRFPKSSKISYLKKVQNFIKNLHLCATSTQDHRKNQSYEPAWDHC